MSQASVPWNDMEAEESEEEDECEVEDQEEDMNMDTDTHHVGTLMNVTPTQHWSVR